MLSDESPPQDDVVVYKPRREHPQEHRRLSDGAEISGSP